MEVLFRLLPFLFLFLFFSEKGSGKEYRDNGCLKSKYKVWDGCLREGGNEQTVATRHDCQVTSRAHLALVITNLE